ncbi:MAG: N-acetylmuramoyl-L-alanine amidase [Rikenellaceae bacterium]|nr:N-acetylmuramoyl-L-alanine amidase [Rikenellaceae bacterium]
MRGVLTMLAIAFALLIPHNGFGAENVAQGVKVIVIDAGHGGSRFPGAGYGGIAEKDINLQVALKVGALIEKGLPEVKVIYTRTTDKMFSSVLADDLQARADIAHRNGGDLFISIHSNAHRNSAVHGVETLIMGESTMEQRANENTLYLNNKDELLDMSDVKTATIVRAYIQNLQFTYGEYSEMMARLIQEEYVKLGYNNRGVRRQPLKVLYATDMPSVLTEIGFMSNPAELKYITSEKGQNEIAGAIFRAVKRYVENVRRSLLLDSATSSEQPQATSAPTPQEQTPAQITEQTKGKGKAGVTGKHYTIQLMASATRISTNHDGFKSYRGKVWLLERSGSLKYKYCYGNYAEKSAAQAQLKEVRKEFPQAFIVTYER